MAVTKKQAVEKSCRVAEARLFCGSLKMYARADEEGLQVELAGGKEENVGREEL
jgi:hypothetical protein